MYTDKVQDQFTSRVPIYDRRSSWILDPGLLKAMTDASNVSPDAEMLDVCCGTGAVSGAFEGKVRRRTGLDLTPAMLEQAKQRTERIVQGSALDLPFDDASFDLVVSRQALHFFDEPAAVIAQMHRVLRPGGQIILGQRVPYGKADAEWMKRLNELKQPLLKTFMLDSIIDDALRSLAFKNISYTDYFLWESINDWISSPETPEENRPKVLEHVRNAPESVRAVHPIEVRGDRLYARWRWVIYSADKE